ncbi:MAG: LPS export ABC transporter periplasmic protein LptC, partial [Candidatus Hydrogenedentes bacterium]|nr:LPS export ABC transporter periplasmic protein LptC [Candidatus Hydrogenedentota bacterium]
MKRNYMAFAAALLIAACGSSKEETSPTAPSATAAPAESASTPAPPAGATEPATAATAPAPSAPAGETVASSTGTKLRFFRDVLESDQPQKPSFELLAERFAMTVDQATGDNVYVVEKATAVAYGKDGTETRFEADGGTFNDTTKTTQLTGHVVCTTGTQRVEMQDVIWTNETMTAATQNPVIVSDGETKLQAGSMEYNTDTRTLSLHALSGAVSLASSETTDAADAGSFQFIDITRGGLGEFVDGQLQHIEDGVALALRPVDPNAKPMVLEAKKIVFGWDAEQRTKPKNIALDGGVSVDGPQGLITANAADLNLAGNSIAFSGNVHGNSESIESFDAERINYDMKSGDSEMI